MTRTVTLFAALLYASSAWAQDADSRAMELYDNGVVLYDEGRYEDAIVAWQEAYRLSERPVLLYNVANAEERLGKYQDALDHLHRYRAYATPDERPTLDRRISSLERRLEEKLMDGAAASPPPPVVPMVASAPVSAAPASSPPATVERRTRAAPIVLYTLGGLGLAAGGAFGGLAYTARNEAGALCVASGEATWCPSDAQSAIDRDQRWSTLADIGFAVGIAGAVGGTIALAIPRKQDAVEVTVHGGRDGAALGLAGSF